MPACALIHDALLAPFSVAAGPDLVLVTVDGRAGEHPLLRTGAASAWIAHHPDRLIIIELGQIGLLDSALVAWLIALAQTAVRSRLVVQGAGARVEGQLRHLRLDRIMTIA
jgi:hypothetical protein